MRWTSSSGSGLCSARLSGGQLRDSRPACPPGTRAPQIPSKDTYRESPSDDSSATCLDCSVVAAFLLRSSAAIRAQADKLIVTHYAGSAEWIAVYDRARKGLLQGRGRKYYGHHWRSGRRQRRAQPPGGRLAVCGSRASSSDHRGEARAGHQNHQFVRRRLGPNLGDSAGRSAQLGSGPSRQATRVFEAEIGQRNVPFAAARKTWA